MNLGRAELYVHSREMLWESVVSWLSYRFIIPSCRGDWEDDTRWDIHFHTYIFTSLQLQFFSLQGFPETHWDQTNTLSLEPIGYVWVKNATHDVWTTTKKTMETQNTLQFSLFACTWKEIIFLRIIFLKCKIEKMLLIYFWWTSYLGNNNHYKIFEYYHLFIYLGSGSTQQWGKGQNSSTSCCSTQVHDIRTSLLHPEPMSFHIAICQSWIKTFFVLSVVFNAISSGAISLHYWTSHVRECVHNVWERHKKKLLTSFILEPDWFYACYLQWCVITRQFYSSGVLVWSQQQSGFLSLSADKQHGLYLIRKGIALKSFLMSPLWYFV